MEALIAHCHDMLQLIIVWNALKTSRRVLGAEMPLPDEAQGFEHRVEQVLTEGVTSLNNWKMREGTEMENRLTDYISESVERCR